MRVIRTEWLEGDTLELSSVFVMATLSKNKDCKIRSEATALSASSAIMTTAFPPSALIKDLGISSLFRLIQGDSYRQIVAYMQ